MKTSSRAAPPPPSQRAQAPAQAQMRLRRIACFAVEAAPDTSRHGRLRKATSLLPVTRHSTGPTPTTTSSAKHAHVQRYLSPSAERTQVPTLAQMQRPADQRGGRSWHGTQRFRIGGERPLAGEAMVLFDSSRTARRVLCAIHHHHAHPPYSGPERKAPPSPRNLEQGRKAF